MNFKPNGNFIYYLYWICERQDIFWKRYNLEKPPYSEDPILVENKFTNVYRILDRSSQYLVKNVIQNGKSYSKEDIVWRIILYKHFNLPSTWDYLIKELGDIDLSTSLSDIKKVLRELNKSGTIYSNAYMLTASFMRNENTMARYGLKTGMPKYELYLRIFEEDLLEKGLIFKILNSSSFTQLFNYLKEIMAVADFIAYQFAQDLNYTDTFNLDENELCAAGPGTRRGIERCFDIEGKVDYDAIVKWVHLNFEELLYDYSKKFNMDLQFKSLPNHMPRVPDLSNCLCESDKYLRVKGTESGKSFGQTRMKNKFNPNPNKIEYIFPEKWGIKI